MIGIALDVTEHKQLQKKLIHQRDDLENRIAERTYELAKINERLLLDIAQREEIETQLRESEERFRTMAEGSPVPVVISEPATGQVLYGNHRLAEMFGTPYETLREQTTLNFYAHPEQREKLIAQMRAEGFVNSAEFQLKRADGTPLWAAVYHRTINFNGQQALLACFLETTQCKATEEALQKDRRLLRRLLDLNERDRQLIAYEIHDGVVQDMSGALMFLESACHSLLLENREIAELSRSCQLLRGGIDEARRIIDGLRPPVLEEAGIIPAIENLITEISDLGLLEVSLSYDVHFDRLAPPIEMAIYRIVQEAVNNAQQHSGARSVKVNVTQQWTYIHISIRDDGKGFDPAITKKRRYGLQGIHERARLLGGSAIIDTSPGKGTEIRATLPISDSLLPPET
jgi:PAS domain S-box-containing protein